MENTLNVVVESSLGNLKEGGQFHAISQISLITLNPDLNLKWNCQCARSMNNRPFNENITQTHQLF